MTLETHRLVGPMIEGKGLDARDTLDVVYGEKDTKLILTLNSQNLSAQSITVPGRLSLLEVAEEHGMVAEETDIGTLPIAGLTAPALPTSENDIGLLELLETLTYR